MADKADKLEKPDIKSQEVRTLPGFRGKPYFEAKVSIKKGKTGKGVDENSRIRALQKAYAAAGGKHCM